MDVISAQSPYSGEVNGVTGLAVWSVQLLQVMIPQEVEDASVTHTGEVALVPEIKVQLPVEIHLRILSTGKFIFKKQYRFSYLFTR